MRAIFSQLPVSVQFHCFCRASTQLAIRVFFLLLRGSLHTLVLVACCADAARIADPKAEVLEAQTGTHVFRKAAATVPKRPADAEGTRGRRVWLDFVASHIEHVVNDLLG